MRLSILYALYTITVIGNRNTRDICQTGYGGRPVPWASRMYCTLEGRRRPCREMLRSLALDTSDDAMPRHNARIFMGQGRRRRGPHNILQRSKNLGLSYDLHGFCAATSPHHMTRVRTDLCGSNNAGKYCVTHHPKT